MENKKGLLPFALDAVVLDCKGIAELSDFYLRLLGGERNFAETNEWVDIISPSGNVKIAYQHNENFIGPTWPDEPDKQQQMAHLDFTVKNHEELQLSVAHAISCGARKTDTQFDPDKWITMIGPAGHPFVLSSGRSMGSENLLV